MRTSRAAATLETAVNVTVALPDAHTGDGAMLKITVAQVVRQLVASVTAPVLSRASRSCTVTGFVLYAALTPFRFAFTATTSSVIALPTTFV